MTRKTIRTVLKEMGVEMRDYAAGVRKLRKDRAPEIRRLMKLLKGQGNGNR